MAWIESHQELRHHPKLSAVCRTLSAERSQVVGHLHFLWWWCMDYAMDGDLSKYDCQQIADASDWKGDAKAYVEALISSGFIDRENEIIRIHDWLVFCGELVMKRLDRRKAKREKAAGNIRRTADKIRRNPPKSAEKSPTQPNPTITNQTKEEEASSSADDSTPKAPTPQNLIDLWNQKAHSNLPRVAMLTPVRETRIKVRLRNYPERHFWESLLEKVNRSPMLRGENDRNWKCSFDWILNENNMAKILEGNYDPVRRNALAGA